MKDTFDASRPLHIAGFTINDFHGKKRTLSVPEVFIYSSNIGTAKMADVVGVEATGSVVHGEQQDRQAGRRAHVGDGAGLDLPGSVLPDEFRAGVGAEQERCG